jgi:hypothetical protein
VRIFDDDEGIVRGYRIRRSLSGYFALGSGCLALGLFLHLFLGNGPWVILEALGGVTVLVVGGAEIVARYRARS